MLELEGTTRWFVVEVLQSKKIARSFETCFSSENDKYCIQITDALLFVQKNDYKFIIVKI